MMRTKQWMAVLALATAAAAPAFADEYGRHPLYMHAQSDLRAAAWQIDHRRPEDGRIAGDEAMVHDEIAAALGELQHAAWIDGKGGDWQPPPDMPLRRDGRLHATIDLLRQAHNDIAREEDDPRARGLQQRALRHVDLALNAAQHAVGDARWRDHFGG
ncbi:hypothetical protein AAFF27_25410 [Xylophilus sp. GW821-FHT01B05]